MRNLIITVILVAAAFGCSTKTPEATENISTQADTVMEFDSALALQLGADQYGMKQYVMAFLKKGPNRDRSKEQADSLQAAHLANIKKMAEAGKLVLAGPFMNDGELRGIYIFNVKTVEEAEALTNSDPAVQAGSLVMDLVPWYGSAALMQVSDLHKHIAKVKF